MGRKGGERCKGGEGTGEEGGVQAVLLREEGVAEFDALVMLVGGLGGFCWEGGDFGGCWYCIVFRLRVAGGWGLVA